MPMSDFAEAATLNYWLNAVAGTPPASVFIALFTVAPDDTGGGTETSGVNYARVQMTAGWTVSGTATRAFNAADIVFAQAGAGGWTDAVAIGIFDLLAGGNLIYWEALDVARTIPAGDIPIFVMNNLGVSQS